MDNQRPAMTPLTPSPKEYYDDSSNSDPGLKFQPTTVRTLNKRFLGGNPW